MTHLEVVIPITLYKVVYICIIKVYNKSLHYEASAGSENILRFEVKYKTKKLLTKLGINSLADLKKRSSYFNLIDDFLKKFDSVLIIDSYNGDETTSKKDQALLTKYTNPNYWIELRKGSRSKATYQKDMFRKIIEKYRLDSWKNDIRDLITEKFAELMLPDCDCEQNLLNAA